MMEKEAISSLHVFPRTPDGLQAPEFPVYCSSSHETVYVSYFDRRPEAEAALPPPPLIIPTRGSGFLHPTNSPATPPPGPDRIQEQSYSLFHPSPSGLDPCHQQGPISTPRLPPLPPNFRRIGDAPPPINSPPRFNLDYPSGTPSVCISPFELDTFVSQVPITQPRPRFRDRPVVPMAAPPTPIQTRFRSPPLGQSMKPYLTVPPSFEKRKVFEKRKYEECHSSPARGCFLQETHLIIRGEKYPLDQLENAYAMCAGDLVVHFRGGKKVYHTFSDFEHAEDFVKKVLERAIILRSKRLDKEIETLLRLSLHDRDIQPGSYVKISESLLGNSTEQTARVLWIHDDMITVQLPSGSAKLPKWYVTGMVDPYDIARLRTFAEESLSKRKKWKSKGEIPEIKKLRENISKTVEWIVEDHFEKWSDKYFIQGHELNKTEVTILVDQKLMRIYLKGPLSDLRNIKNMKCDSDFRKVLDSLDSAPMAFWTSNPQEQHQFKLGMQHIISQDRKTLYSRIHALTRMVEEFISVCGDDEKKLLTYLLYSFVKGTCLCCPQNGPSPNRCLLSPLDLYLMLELAHPEFIHNHHSKTIYFFSQVFSALEVFASKARNGETCTFPS